jgi:leucyl-tRNA synthetase
MTHSEPARYNPQITEKKWQAAWEKAGVFATPEPNGKPDYFVLEMFPYPSGKIHMGHVRNYTLGDVVARYRRAKGFNVLYPMGWDAFGLPAENAAIERKVHPGAWTMENIASMREQIKAMGLSYDWSRELTTCTPDYYQHEQRFFLKMREAGIAYRKEAVVNWDPVDHTVLANEQVVDGCGWRSGAKVERRTLTQWFLRISDFADDLLTALPTLEHWPQKVRSMQERWIGKSTGAHVELALEGRADTIAIYTTRPDTFYGMSFVAMAAEHPLAKEIAGKNPEAAAFIQSCAQLGTSEEAIEKAEKQGFDTGLKALNPFTGDAVPIYIANFVLMDYGTGAVFGCPAHDERDHAFATKYGLPILPVISGGDSLPYMGEGTLIHSPLFNGMAVETAKIAAIEALEKNGRGKGVTNFRLRDWGISRQRYWGCPIPMIICPACGDVAVPEEQLPVTLPEDVDFDTPGNPLERHPTWKHVSCPACGGDATRETDTFDTFFESSWYFACFASGGGAHGIDAEAAKRWLPVQQYIGGIEHAVLHLLYARFFTRALKQCGVLDVDEPFAGLMTQGMVCHATFKDANNAWVYPEDAQKTDTGWQRADGTPVTQGRSEKMSKSKKNTVDPRHIIDTYGADTARLFMLSDSPPERDLEWTESGIDGAWRYIGRFYRLVQEVASLTQHGAGSEDQSIMTLTHKTIAHVTEDIEAFRFNKAVARIRELTNALEKAPKNSASTRFGVTIATQLIAPMLPHLAETCWDMLGESGMVCQQHWPIADTTYLVEDTITMAVQVNGKLRNTLELPADISKDGAEAAALADEKITQAIAGKTIRKVIVVPGKIINVVAA